MAPDEEDRGAGRRPRRGLGEVRNVDAVGQDLRAATEREIRHVSCVIRHRCRDGEPVDPAPQRRTEHGVPRIDTSHVRRVEGSDERFVGRDEKRLGRARHQRLVEVDHVRLDDAARLQRPLGDRLAGRDRRDRPVGRESRRRTHGDDSTLGGRAVAGSNDPRIGTELAQIAGEPENLVLHAAEQRQRVRRHDKHSHQNLAPLPFTRSLGQFGCIRCHCSGAARISSSKL